MRLPAVITSLVFLGLPLTARDFGASTRALGMGDAVYAVGLGTAGLYFNPATMGQIIQYAIDAGYGYYAYNNVHDFHVSIVDSLSNRWVAGGVSYTMAKSLQEAKDFLLHDVRVGAAVGLGDPNEFKFFLGSTFRYLNVSGDLIPNEVEPVSMAAFDAGIVMDIKKFFHIGLVGQNLLSRSKVHAPKLLGTGIGFSALRFDMGVSVLINFSTRHYTTASPAIGLEYLAVDSVPIRVGFIWDKSRKDKDLFRATVGLGYVSKLVGFDCSFSHDLRHKNEYIIQGSIRFFLPGE